MSDIDGYACQRGHPGYKKYMLVQYGFKSVPPMIFLVTATVRLLELRYVAVHRESLSKSFKAKVCLCIVIAVAYTSMIPINYSSKADTSFSSWINQCENDNFSWLNLVQTMAWLLSAYLVVYEYKRLLQEAIYSNKMFWVLNLVCELVSVLVLWKIYIHNWFMLTSALVYSSLNVALVTLMVVSKK